MECPFCGKIDNGVIDSRPTKEGTAIRRRRKCLACAGRFTTYESTPEQLLLLLMRRHAGRGATSKNSQAVLSFMSNALKGLSDEIEKLIGEVGKPEPPKKVKKPKRRVARKPKPKPKPKKRAPVRKIVARKPKKVPARAKKAKKLTATAEVLKVLKGHKKGVDIPKLKEKTGFADTKIRAIIYRASKEGKIKRIGRGVYVSA
ncbi:MAG: hypothetical protein V3U56_08550 [Syntrophobacteria bacterium]